MYVESKLPDSLNKVLDYLTSPGAVLPLLLLLVLFIYYLLSTVASLKDANKELKSQIRKDKDTSEGTNLGVMMGGLPEIVTDPPAPVVAGKHVRIAEQASCSGGGPSNDPATSSKPMNDKSNLLESYES